MTEPQAPFRNSPDPAADDTCERVMGTMKRLKKAIAGESSAIALMALDALILQYIAALPATEEELESMLDLVTANLRKNAREFYRVNAAMAAPAVLRDEEPAGTVSRVDLIRRH